LVLAVDAIFILLHVLYREAELLSDPRFSLGREDAYASIFGYLVEGCIVLAVCALAVRLRQPLYFAWAALFLYLLLDDYLMIHEKITGSIVRPFFGFSKEDTVLGINAHDLVEDAAMALLGLMILSMILVIYVFGDRTFKKVSRRLVILLTALAFCGIVVDLIHAAIVRSPLRRELSEVHRSLAIVEDGGELVVISLILWFVVLQLKRQERITL
jgi:hypothetical protein